MRSTALIILTAVLAFEGCDRQDDKPDKPNGPAERAQEAPKQAAQATDDWSGITVVCVPRYYVAGQPGEKMLTFLSEADQEKVNGIVGIILEITEPPQYAGKIISMHHDGVLASGNPFKGWALGHHYRFEVGMHEIGSLAFGRCSVGFIRKDLDTGH